MPIVSTHCVVPQPVSWLWPDRIPLGKLAILDGDPDLGKSLLTLDLCARLSAGRPFPDARPGPGPANALVLSAEDNAADTIAPRLKHFGADPQRIFLWQRERDDEHWPWRFPADADLLDAALGQSNARLAVIDPIMAFLDASVVCASDQSVRRALAPLMHLAEKHRCAIILLRHLNKQSGGQSLYRGLGSIAFVAACRFAMMVGRDPLVPDQCVLAQVRNSLGRPQPSLAYQLGAAKDGQAAISWLGVSQVGADELLVGDADSASGPRQRAVTFLEDFLAAGPRTATDIWEAGQQASLSVRTLYRAKQSLGLACIRVTDNGRCVHYWLLPGQELPGNLTNEPELERQFTEMTMEYLPPTPLG